MNVLVGRNGEGKTNVLEAVYYLSLLRSFRTGKIMNLRQYGEPAFYLEGEISEDEGLPIRIGVSYGKERRLMINGSPVNRSSAFINQFLCLTLIPQDLELIQGPSSMRRRCMDIAISQWSKPYLYHLQAFQLALQERNAMLKEPERYDQSAFRAYDELLVREGAVVEWMRHEFVLQLNEILAEKSPFLLTRERVMSVSYQSRSGFKGRKPQSVNDIEAWYAEELQSDAAMDRRQGMTHAGPHRSELVCMLNGKVLADFGSEGECRMASLALRFACLEVLRRQGYGEKITVLVDDVVGELDAGHRALFFQEIAKSEQVVFTCTQIPPELPAPDFVMHVGNGAVTWS